MPIVSVLMPCYNAVGTLVEALESLARQTIEDYEVVAVEDGSSDGTARILQEWAASDQRIRPIFQPHRGIVLALNAGVNACRAQYIARLDADDLAHPQRLELQLTFMDEHPETAVVGCLVRGYPPSGVGQGTLVYLKWQNSLISDDDIRRETFVESPIAHPSALIRKKWLTKVDGYQEHGWPEDYDLWLRLYLAGARFAKVPEYLLDWREHPLRLTRQDSRYSLENFLRAKAHYLARGPLLGRDAVLLWGAGMVGRRLSKHLLRQGVPLVAFIDVDPAKIGRTRRGVPILAPQELLSWWSKYTNPVVLAAVGAQGARRLIRAQLTEYGLVEARHWWGVA